MPSSGDADADAPHRTTLTFTYRAERRAAAVAAAVEREAGRIDGDRTVASVARDGARVEVRLRAADLVALRAGHNTWCSLVAAAERAAATAARHGTSGTQRTSGDGSDPHAE